MSTYIPVSIPLSGLANGHYDFSFKVDSSFFQHFDQGLVKKGAVEIEISMEKKENLIILDFTFEGNVVVKCDRCLKDFGIPVEGVQNLLVKYDEEPREEFEVVYITNTTEKLDLSKYVFEFIAISIPLKRTHDVAGLQCDPEMMKYLIVEEEAPEEEQSNPIWDALKDLNKK